MNKTLQIDIRERDEFGRIINGETTFRSAVTPELAGQLILEQILKGYDVQATYEHEREYINDRVQKSLSARNRD